MIDLSMAHESLLTSPLKRCNNRCADCPRHRRDEDESLERLAMVGELQLYMWKTLQSTAHGVSRGCPSRHHLRGR